MKWVQIIAEESWPRVCHPDYAKAFEKMCSEQGSQCKKTDITETHIDFGGMVFANEPRIKVELEANRNITCFRFQAACLVDALKSALAEPTWKVDEGFYRIESLPGWLIILSKEDIQKIIQEIESQTDPDEGLKHAKIMKKVLHEANRHVARKAFFQKVHQFLKKFF